MVWTREQSEQLLVRENWARKLASATQRLQGRLAYSNISPAASRARAVVEIRRLKDRFFPSFRRSVRARFPSHHPAKADMDSLLLHYSASKPPTALPSSLPSRKLLTPNDIARVFKPSPSGRIKLRQPPSQGTKDVAMAALEKALLGLKALNPQAASQTSPGIRAKLLPDSSLHADSRPRLVAPVGVGGCGSRGGEDGEGEGGGGESQIWRRSARLWMQI